MRLILIALGLFVVLAGPSDAGETMITILTATPSGIWYPLGTTLSSIYAKAIPGANVTVQASPGSVENLRLLEAGDGELAFTLGDALADAWAGNKEGGFDDPLRKLRAVAKIYPQFLHIVASDRSGIRMLADLKAKHVSFGPGGSATALEAAAIFKADGFTDGDLKDFVRVPFTQSFRMVGEGALDAAVQSGAMGTGNLRHILASGQARLIPIPAGVVAKVGNPVYVPATIPAGTYDRQPSDLSRHARGGDRPSRLYDDKIAVRPLGPAGPDGSGGQRHRAQESRYGFAGPAASRGRAVLPRSRHHQIAEPGCRRV